MTKQIIIKVKIEGKRFGTGFKAGVENEAK
jgi:hypothetical protein